ncbi:MAG: cytochrome c/FTR1 family iron permease, partial [Pseudomonadales bacterium]
PAAVAPLYAELCAGCHGAFGRGDGPAGAAFDPAPTDFHDANRARQRSLYGLYSTLTLGIQGTGMPAFSSLTESQRWALAFYVAGLRDVPEEIAQGQRLWNEGVMRNALPSLASFTSKPPAAFETTDERAAPVLAYLRHQPEALTTASSDPIQRTIDGLQDVVSAYFSDQPDTALQLALSAYLEGYELIEAPLRTLDDELAVGIERDMQVLRNMIREGVPAHDLESAAASIETRLQEASALLSTSGSLAATLFTSAFLILLREGLEAILLLAAMSLYLRRTNHKTAMRYLHVGWIGALIAGAMTWIGIKTVIDISGAQREVIEGVAALLAAFVLLYVGIWLHRYSNAAQWQAFLDERLGRSLSTGTLWGIAALSFIAVYREILETVLFYEALWLQSGTVVPLVTGASMAALALVAAGWIVFRIGARLPLRRFFQANGVLMFVLALVFAGKGIAALQEMGWVAVTFVSVPRIDWLGIYPTAQSVGLQLAIACIGGIWLVLLSRRKPATALA